ncbi:MAG: hypothetical protein WC477_07465 [Patescibacteria group bacterium]
MRFSDKDGVRSCYSCGSFDFNVVLDESSGKGVECARCGSGDYFQFKEKRWEGEKERYEKDKRNY